MEKKQTINQFFLLLRTALWEITEDTAPFDVPFVDWNEIRELAFRQTVVPLIYNGVLELPMEVSPHNEWLRSLYPYVLRTHQATSLINNALQQVSDGLTSHGISPVLLKGSAYARHYPLQRLRQCGDIDLYIGEADYQRACQSALQLGLELYRYETKKHSVFILRGVYIELHRVAAILSDTRANRRFQKWSRSQLLGSDYKMSTGLGNVSIPTPLFDVVFVFQHLFHHFQMGGIGLRQLCDWVMLLHAHHNTIDEEQLKTVLRSFGLIKAWKYFGCIAVSRLGLPQHEFPFYSKCSRSKTDKILAIILEEGNFGKFSLKRKNRPSTYWKRKTFSFISQQKRFWMLGSVFPKEVFSYQLKFLSTGVLRIVKDKLYKK